MEKVNIPFKIYSQIHIAFWKALPGFVIFFKIMQFF